MDGKNEGYRCVHCGASAEALFTKYGPSVLKLNKCIKCGDHVDKYIEYDPVIVAIDLILISREAQRHVIYNTDFKSYWKIFVILTMLETYGVWHDNSLLTMAFETVCNLHNTSSGGLKDNCKVWTEQIKVDDVDMFIWEKNFYVHFISVVMGVAAFILTLHLLMTLFSLIWPKNKVDLVSTVKAFTLAYVSVLFTAPVLVWGAPALDAAAGAAPAARGHALHHILAFIYSALVFFNIFTGIVILIN